MTVLHRFKNGNLINEKKDSKGNFHYRATNISTGETSQVLWSLTQGKITSEGDDAVQLEVYNGFRMPSTYTVSDDAVITKLMEDQQNLSL